MGYIYTIKNIHTGRVYVGSSTGVSIRWSGHKCSLRGGRHANKLLQADWDHYGEESFLFEVVEEIPMGYTPRRDEQDRLLATECVWMHHYKNCTYNIRMPEVSPVSSRVVKDKGKSLISKARSDAIQEAAHRLLDEYQIDITRQVIILPLARDLAQRINCHIDTAKRHISRAIRYARGEETARVWGGPRPGAGKPKEIADD